MRLYRVYGELATDALRDDPYVLTDPYFHADFSLVDAFALELDVAADDERRVEAGILFELSYNLSNGHTFIPQPKLCAATAALLNLDTETIEAGLLRLTEQERLVVDTVAGLQACYLPEFYEAETYITSRLLQMAEKQFPEPSNLERLLTSIEQAQEIRYASLQREAIRRAATQQLLIVTGGPGTGKTTVMSGILALFDALKIKTQLAAPTGRASKRLSEVTGREASTIHRLLEAQFDEATGMMSFYHDEEEPLNIDAMIGRRNVDGRFAVDDVFAAGVKARLPPDSGRRPGPAALSRRGKRFFRSHSQRKNCDGAPYRNFPAGAAEPDRDECPRGQPRRAAGSFAQGQGLLFHAPQKPGGAGADGAGAVCGASSEEHGHRVVRHSGPLADPEGRDRNAGAQSGAAGGSQSAADRKAREKARRIFLPRGRRVMQIRNNYDIMWKRSDGLGAGTGIFNGDIGTISRIDFEAELVSIDFDDRQAEYSFDMLSELEPAYAMTVHKSQGASTAR